MTTEEQYFKFMEEKKAEELQRLRAVVKYVCTLADILEENNSLNWHEKDNVDVHTEVAKSLGAWLNGTDYIGQHRRIS